MILSRYERTTDTFFVSCMSNLIKIKFRKFTNHFLPSTRVFIQFPAKCNVCFHFDIFRSIPFHIRLKLKSLIENTQCDLLNKLHDAMQQRLFIALPSVTISAIYFIEWHRFAKWLWLVKYYTFHSIKSELKFQIRFQTMFHFSKLIVLLLDLDGRGKIYIFRIPCRRYSSRLLASVYYYFE